MSTDQAFSSVHEFAFHLRRLHAKRKGQVIGGRTSKTRRTSLTRKERAEILKKSGGRCHLCGGEIDEANWEADHVFPHSAGGTGALENYLPAHRLCNNYRWHYSTEEFQWILKLGVWFRTQIEKETTIGSELGAQFVSHERRRVGRRKSDR